MPTPCFRLAAIALLLGCGFAPLALADESIVLVPQRLSERTWFFQGEAGMASAQNRGYMSNAGFVVTSDGVVVFDALGTPALGEAMLAAIRKRDAGADPCASSSRTIMPTTSMDCRR